jgi:D-arabinose 1-dehydrogenase-like Zn-dependent alcohol dehydrogenase
MKIHAWAAKGPKQELLPYIYEKEIGENDVLVQVNYCSLLKADTFFIDNLWGDSKYPLVPSSEIFGIVIQKGNQVTNMEVGEYVGIGYQVYSCLKCDYCLQGKEQFCRKQRLIEVHENGGLAEHVIVDANFVYTIPPQLRKPEYVSLMGYGLTAYSAIKHSNLISGMNVGVIGVGNLGHLAVQILFKLGMKVTAFSHTPSKVGQLKKLGVSNFVDPSDNKQLEVNEKKYDFLLVTTYHPYNWSQFISLLKPEGELHFIGLPSGNISFPAILLADYARRKVTGSYIGSRHDMVELLDFAKNNTIKSITQIHSMNEINTVVSQLRDNKISFNAVIEMKVQ